MNISDGPGQARRFRIGKIPISGFLCRVSVSGASPEGVVWFSTYTCYSTNDTQLNGLNICSSKNERKIPPAETVQEIHRLANEVKTTLENASIDADILAALKSGTKQEMLNRHSSDADCIFMNFDLSKADNPDQWYDEIGQQIDGLPTTILVHSTIKSDILI